MENKNKIYSIGEAFQALDSFLDEPIEVDSEIIVDENDVVKLKEGYVGQTLDDFFSVCTDAGVIEKITVCNTDIDDYDESVLLEGGSYDDIPQNVLEASFSDFDVGGGTIVINCSEEEGGTDFYQTVQDFIDDYNGDEVEICVDGETVFTGDKSEVPDEYLEYMFNSFDSPKYISANVTDVEESNKGLDESDLDLDGETKTPLKESKSFNIGDSKDLEDALDFVNKDEDEETIEQVIDLDAETEEDLSPTYVGKVLGQCTTCHSLIYMEPDSLVKAEDVDSDNDEDIYNVDEECVVCGATDGYVLLGKVVPINDKEVDKVDEPKEDETEDDGKDDDIKEENSIKEGNANTFKNSGTDDILDEELDEKLDELKEENNNKGAKIASIIASALNKQGGHGPMSNEEVVADGNTITLVSQAGLETYKFNDDGSVDNLSIDDMIKKMLEDGDIEESEIEDIREEYSHFNSIKDLLQSDLTWFMRLPEKLIIKKVEEILDEEKELKEARGAGKGQKLDESQFQISRGSREFDNVIKTYYKKYGKHLQVDTMIYDKDRGKYYMYNDQTDYTLNTKRLDEELEESTITEVAGGMSKGLSIEDIAAKHGVSVEDIESQIKLGVKVEQEHTSDVEEAKKIAMDHLVEFPDYYDRLVKMEKEAEANYVDSDEIEELDENKFDSLISSYLKESTYKTTDGFIDGNKIRLEGTITNKDGITSSTQFIFESLKMDNKIIKLKGINESLGGEFTILGKQDKNTFIPKVMKSRKPKQ